MPKDLGLFGKALEQKLRFDRPSTSNRGGTIDTEALFFTGVDTLKQMLKELLTEASQLNPTSFMSMNLGVDMSDLALNTSETDAMQLIRLKIQVVNEILTYKQQVAKERANTTQMREELRALREMKLQKDKDNLMNDEVSLNARIKALEAKLGAA